MKNVKLMGSLAALSVKVIRFTCEPPMTGVKVRKGKVRHIQGMHAGGHTFPC